LEGGLVGVYGEGEDAVVVDKADGHAFAADYFYLQVYASTARGDGVSGDCFAIGGGEKQFGTFWGFAEIGIAFA